MGSPTRRPPEARAPYVGPRCAACGEWTLVAPCVRPECTRWTVVCWGCPDVADRFIDSDGRCESCRVQ